MRDSIPMVSVVIPAYNAEQWIDECIDSVMKQDYPKIEIVVVDDASTDNTKQTLLKILNSTHPCSMVISCHTQNMGECVSSFDGFTLAIGKYICRLSADDAFVNNTHISEQVKLMETSGKDWCYNQSNLVGEWLYGCKEKIAFWFPTRSSDEDSLKFLRVFDNFILNHPYIALLICLRGRNPVNSSTLMIRRSCYEDVKWCKEYRTDCDGMIIMRMLLKGKVGVSDPHVGAFYRIHPGQGSYNPKYLNEVQNIRTRIKSTIAYGDYPQWLKIMTRLI